MRGRTAGIGPDRTTLMVNGRLTPAQRRVGGRRLSIRVGVRCLSPLIHSAIPLTMINRRLQSQFQSAGWADRIDERRSIVLAGQVGPEPFREGIATFHTQSSMIRKGVART